MPPTPGDVHVNRPLTNISIATLQEATNFVAGQMFPMVPVMKQSDRYFVYNQGDLLRDEAKRRAPGKESAGMEYDIDNSPSYHCDKWAIHHDVDDDTRANADNPLRPDQDAAEILAQKLLMKRERVFMDAFFKTGVWDTELTGVAASPSSTEFIQWDASGSDPVADIENLKSAVSAKHGFEPNAVLLNDDVYKACKNNAAVIERIKYTERGIVTPEILASLFDVEKVLVARGVTNTAAKGATDSPIRIGGKNALVAYVQPRPSLRKPTAGYIFTWAGLYGAGQEGMRTKRFRMEHLNSMRIETEYAWDMKVVASDMAGFLGGVIA